MTLEEKIMQLHCVWQKKTETEDASTNFPPARAHAIGMLARPSELTMM